VIHLKTAEEIESIGRGGKIIADLIEEIPQHARPGATTRELDAFCDEFIVSHEGATPAFKGLYGFPGAVCISLNDEVVHGIPSSTRVLQDGDIVSVDVGVRLNGWCADSAWTFAVGEIGEEARSLMEITERSLWAAVEAATRGNHVGDIGSAVIGTVEGTSYGIIRDLVGHGIGREVHEEPQVPNVGRPGQGPLLRPGMVLAIEPMLSAGTPDIRTLEDGWTVVTADRTLSAHFEHTVAITEEGPRVLTAASASKTA
jgi:methionyl aminopeptidase